MTSAARRERAEAAFGHVQHAASEMIAAAQDALAVLDDVVSTADLGEILASLQHLGQSVRKRPSPPAPTVADNAATGRSSGGVQRVSVR